MKSIPRFSVSQPILVNVLVVLILLGGAFCYGTLNQEVMPEIPLKIAIIQTPYPGASPEDVEKTVTVPIEDHIESVEGIDQFFSVSVQGRSVIIVEFLDRVRDVGDKVRKLQQQVDLADKELPEEAEDPIVQEQEYTIPVVSIAASGTVDQEAFKSAMEQLETRIQRLEGVNSIDTLGVPEREVHVFVDTRRLDAYGLDLSDVERTLRSASQDLPGGEVRTENGEGLIVIHGELRNTQEMEKLVLKRNPGGSMVRLEDVMTDISYGFEDHTFLARVNGTRSALAIVKKSTDGDAIQIVDTIRERLPQWEQTLPSQVSLSLHNDSSKYIRRRINTMNESLLWGLALVLVGLLLLLHWRVALMTALGIPVSLAFAMVAGAWFGATINMITLFSFIVVLGVIVDDAIIISENCFRYIENGLTPVRAAIEGTAEVFWPVVLAVATNIAAFLPLLMIEGRIGKFTQWIPLIAIFAFLGSLVEAFLVLPSHVADWVNPPEETVKHPILNGARIVYRYILKQCLRLRYIVGPAFLLIAAGTIYFGFTYMSIVFFNNQYLDYARINVHAEGASGLEQTDRKVADLERQLRSNLPEGAIDSVISVSGRSSSRGGFFRTRHNIASMTVDFTPSFSRKFDSETIFRKLRAAITDTDGLRRLRFKGMKGGPPQGRDIHVEISGPNLETARKIAQKSVRILRKQPGTMNVTTNYEPGKWRYLVQPDRSRAAYYGIDTRQIARSVRGLYRGNEALEIRRGEDQLDVVVRGSRDHQFKPALLRQLTVRSPGGNTIPLDYLMDTGWERGTASRTRFNGRPTVTVYGDVDENRNSIPDVLAPLKDTLKPYETESTEVDVKYKGGQEDIDTMVTSLSRAGVIAVLLIFLLMGTLFRNLGHSLVVLFTIPFALIGIILGMLISNLPLGFMALMGTVAVAGVVVNDSMILVNFVNNSRLNGNSASYGLLKAGTLRFRPVILTTITTMAGLLPLAIGVSGQETILIPMALAIIWGILFSTVLTLLVVPSLYRIAEDLYTFFDMDPLHHHRKMRDLDEPNHSSG